MTRLQRMCEALGWQGGTIWQVEDELKIRGFIFGLSILEFPEVQFDILVNRVKSKGK